MTLAFFVFPLLPVLASEAIPDPRLMEDALFILHYGMKNWYSGIDLKIQYFDTGVNNRVRGLSKKQILAPVIRKGVIEFGIGAG